MLGLPQNIVAFCNFVFVNFVSYVRMILYVVGISLLLGATCNYSGDGPLLVAGHLGERQVMIMIDTGADYDCIRADTAIKLKEAESSCYIGDLDLYDQHAGSAFSDGPLRAAKGYGEWDLSVYGSYAFGGKRQMHTWRVALHEFESLNEEVILGLPFMDLVGGLETANSWVHLNSVWMSRVLPTPTGQHQIQSICRTPHIPIVHGEGSFQTRVDDKGWYMLDLVAHTQQPVEAGQKYWLEDAMAYKHLHVMEHPVAVGEDLEGKSGLLRVFAKAESGHVVDIDNHKVIANIRCMTDEDTLVYDSLGHNKAISVVRNSYKARAKTDEQARHFDDLIKEIETKRKEVAAEPWDQLGPAYKNHIREVAKSLSGTKNRLCPDTLLDEIVERILVPFSDCFWHDGCAAPSIRGYKAHIDLKPGAPLKKTQQPYSLSKFDQARIAYHIEEQVNEGKIRRLGPDEKPPCVVPVFMVDKKGSLLGRMVGAYQYLNPHTEDYFHPAPDASAIFSEACGHTTHSTLDCVWGFSGVDTDDETALLLSIICHLGVYAQQKVPFGPKQGPPLYQAIQDDIFGAERKPDGSKLAHIFVDDTYIGDGDLESHILSLKQLLERARKSGVQYRLTKCRLAFAEVALLGFNIGKGGRSPDPAKVKQLKEWPPYESCADIVSHLYFGSYLREFLGPEFIEKTEPLHAYRKQGADFDAYKSDKAAHEAREWLISQTLEKATLVQPDWQAAAQPWKSGRPFLIFIDASSVAWCSALCQQDKAGGPPRIIAFVSRGFDKLAQNWSAFEREFAAFRDGYEAMHKYVTGFPVFVLFDHKNIERAEVVLTNRRASKKLINWVADCQPMLHSVHRLWIDGKSNVITDAGSRAGWVDKVARFVALPVQSVLQTIKEMFTAPDELAKKCEQRNRDLGNPKWSPIDEHAVTVKTEPLEGEPTRRKPADCAGKTSSYSNFPEGVTCTTWEPPNEYTMVDADGDTDMQSFAGEDAMQKIPPNQRGEYKLGYPNLTASQPTFESSSLYSRDDMSESFYSAREANTQEAGVQSRPEQSDSSVQHSSFGYPGASDAPSTRLFSEVDDRRDDFKRKRIQSMSLASFGTDAGADFLEVGGESNTLTDIARVAKLTVEAGTDADFSQDADSRKLMRLISERRPFHTHMSPAHNVTSMWNMSSIALHIHNEGLFGCIELHRGARNFGKLGQIVAVSQLAGWFYIDVDGCMFDARHPATGTWRLLTNAWYLVPLGRMCDGTHKHSDLEVQGYPREFCKQYVKLIQDGRKAVGTHRRDIAALISTSDFHVLYPSRWSGQYPCVPLSFPTGRFKQEILGSIQRAESKAISPLPEVDPAEVPDVDVAPEALEAPIVDEAEAVVEVDAPLDFEPAVIHKADLSDLGLSIRDQTEYETLINLVADQKVPIVKISHGKRADGREDYQIRFAKTIFSSIRMRDVDSISIPCIRSRTAAGLGHEAASIIVHHLLRASNGLMTPGRFGVGVVGENGFHGNETGTFYVHEPELSVKDWWNHKCDTFVPMRVYCTNSSFVRRTRTGAQQCKCHGHPLDPELPGETDPLRYADGTATATRVRARDFISKMRSATEAIFTHADVTQSFFGYDDANWELASIDREVDREAVLKLTQFFWSAVRQPFTAVHIGKGEWECRGNGRHEGYITAWIANSWIPVEYTVHIVLPDGSVAQPHSNGTLDPYQPMKFYGDLLIRFTQPVYRVAFLCAPLDTTDQQTAFNPHRRVLESYGFPLPSGTWNSVLDTTMTALQIERARFAELLREGTDTRALIALFWWATPVSGDYRKAHTAMIEASDHFDSDPDVEHITDLDADVGDRGDGGQLPTVSSAQLELTGPQADAETGSQERAEPGSQSARAPGFDPSSQPDSSPSADSENSLFKLSIDGNIIDVTGHDLSRIHHITQVPMDELKVAAKHIREYRWDMGILQRHIYNTQTGMHEWYSVVPEGGWKAVEVNGKTRRMSLRKYVILLAHSSPTGGHRDRDKTCDAIGDSGLWWPNLRVNVDSHIKTCLVCRYAKGKTLVTGHMRSREAEGPFRILVMDFVGPQYPKTARNNVYMFTCICIFSGWFWAVAVEGCESTHAARAFAERVMLDICGVPVLLCSDRGKAFIEGVMSYLEATFGIRGILGSAWHPESQGPVEAPHKVYKNLCREFMREFGNQWDMIVPQFQWVIRTSSKVYNAKFTPYEIITGLKPRLPLDAVMSTPTIQAKRSPDTYVTELVHYLKKVHNFVQSEHKKVREQEGDRRLKARTIDRFKVGDYVMLKTYKPPPQGHSGRFGHATDTRVFQIYDAPAGLDEARTVTLMDPATGSTQFEFAQPVSTDRLIPVEVLPLTRPISERTRLRCNGRDGTIVATCIDGRVHIKWDDVDAEEVIDLSTVPHEFILSETP